jgi:hypothetical protein
LAGSCMEFDRRNCWLSHLQSSFSQSRRKFVVKRE